MDENGDSGLVKNRSKRQKQDKHGRLAALERLKQIKGGTKSKYDIKEEASVYEEVDEKEYSRIVQERQVDDWIIDDDGAGYVEDGREIFDDDITEADSQKTGSSGSKGKNKYNPPTSRKPPPPKKGTIKSMFMAAQPKKPEKEIKLEDDKLLENIMQEITSDETSVSGSLPYILKPKSAKLPSKKSSEKKPAHNPFAVKSTPVRSTPSPRNSARPLKPRAMNYETSPRVLTKKQGISSSPENISDMQIKQEPLDSFDMFPDEDIAMDSQNIEEINSQELVQTPVKEEELIEEVKEEDFDLMDDTEFPEDVLDEPAVKKEEIKEQAPEWKNLSNEEAVFQVDISSDLPVTVNEDGDNILQFFWFDAYEDYFKNPGVVHLFGKVYVPASKAYTSCCVTVRNIMRRIYVLPRQNHHDLKMDEESNNSVTMKDVYNEFSEVARKHRIEEFKSKVSTKKYAFEKADVPDEADYLEVVYPANFPRLPSDLKGNTFSTVFGTNTSSLETFLLDQKIKGPCWLNVKNPGMSNLPVSWCKLEVVITRPDDITVGPSQAAPPMVVMSLGLRTVVNPSSHQNEIVAASVLAHSKFAIDKQHPNPYYQTHFCALTKPSSRIFPFDFRETVARYNNTKVEMVESERSMLIFLLGKIQRIDPDIIVGHDIFNFDLDVLLHRLNVHKIPNWSRIGRLKRGNFPGSQGKQDRNPTSGRLICDIKNSAKELMRLKSYELTELVSSILHIKRFELNPEDILSMYNSSTKLLQLVDLTMMDADFVLRLMCELNVLPLALQITNIAGNVMSRTLLGGRSERNEFLLLHAFHEKNFICPDKSYNKKQVQKVVEDDEDEVGTSRSKGKQGRRKPAYSGGLVLEPKKGFYDKYILLMDFNSLYPSIIQEYNICFTTVSRTMPKDSKNEEEETIPPLPGPNLETGVLPSEIRKLVESRKQVKQLMKTPDLSPDLKLQYDIRQKALKLTANSMYGCLGFTASRFYAKPLAALVTSRGREILMQTKDLVEKMGLNVIYGDTDSIMINTNCNDMEQIMKLGNKIKSEVNKLYRQLEIDIDGVFKSMLLLKKKKYAALSVTMLPNGKMTTTKEMKGLDIVRRDWSELARKTGEYVIEEILSDKVREDIIENIHSYLMTLAVKIKEDALPLSEYTVTKQLTKNPEDYPDKKSLSHVQVALRLNSKGGKKLKHGDTVTYVICTDGSNLSATQRAYHPEELKTNENLKIDKTYYLANQIHPVVSRICDPIEGTDAAMIAEVLGLDPSAYKQSIRYEGEDEFLSTETKLNNIEQFRDCERITFHCPSEDCPGIVTPEKLYEVQGQDVQFTLASCPVCKKELHHFTNALCNQMTSFIRTFIKKYYTKWLFCEDTGCGYRTRRLPLRFARNGPLCSSCERAVLHPEYSDFQLYMQLTYFSQLFDVEKAAASLSDIEKRSPCVSGDENNKRMCRHLQSVAKHFLSHNGYSIVNLESTFGGLFTLQEHNKSVSV